MRLYTIPSFYLFFLLFLVACGEKPPTDPRVEPPLVRVSVVKHADTAVHKFSGVVAARTQSDLGFRVSGKIAERLVDTGQAVTQGQALLRLDPDDLALQARALQEAVAAARARAEQAAYEEGRYRDLVAAGTVSRSVYDQVKAAADTAGAELAAAQAQAEVAQNNTSYATLRADADGMVVATLAEPGQVVSAGQTVLRIARDGQREAVIHLPETLRPALGSGAYAQLYGAAAQEQRTHLRLLSDAADPLTRTFEARYTLSGALAQAPLGATVTVTIPAEPSATKRLQIPVSAVFDPGDGAGVWVVTGEPATVVWRPVQVVALVGEVAQVEGQLGVGERVVALGAHLLHASQSVRLDAVSGVALAGDAHE
ncbi:efflux RND transporter periplasmic adaptor subunit [Teredinibacter turnerae]|uniref:efflux RND transporter periplasmic adaptor subunit n=1 Tax=Teredinibacter turnerae TaxID=2426 RepID=UPI000371B01E|nr:efflux RND transporter periplasmic adaptor subunit [Teredinibacter turnerae]